MYHKMLAAMLLNQKAWLVSPSISIPTGCHGAGNDYHLRSVSEWWTWKTLNVQLLIIFSLHIMSNSTHKQSSSLIFMTKTGSSWKWPYGNLKWMDYVHSDSEASFFFNNRVFLFTDILAGFTFNNRVLRLPAIVLLNTTFRPGNSGLLRLGG